MPQIVVQSRDIVSQHGFPGAQIVREGEVAVIQSEGEEVIILVPLFLRIRLSAAPEQQAAAAAGAESHVDVYPVADYPASRRMRLMTSEEGPDERTNERRTNDRRRRSIN